MKIPALIQWNIKIEITFEKIVLKKSSTGTIGYSKRKKKDF